MRVGEGEVHKVVRRKPEQTHSLITKRLISLNCYLHSNFHSFSTFTFTFAFRHTTLPRHRLIRRSLNKCTVHRQLM